ncbi:lysozyme [Advenella sp. EE-W14]|uniref:lysozyme n=1 Tax=Advenella sp. EE-W14 TaxID=2722705 RepID=UPI00145CB121|nr:lysozyme [Advenella sp. EE-W14]
MLKKRLIALIAAGAGAVTIATVAVSDFEGRSNKAYRDVVGIPTICDGYTHGVKMGDYKTDAECDALLRKELQASFSVVDSAVKVSISEPTKAALASFVYNVGAGAFRSSTLLKKLNSGDRIGACNELKRWVYAGGKKWNGLIKRRDAENWLCLQ